MSEIGDYSLVPLCEFSTKLREFLVKKYLFFPSRAVLIKI